MKINAMNWLKNNEYFSFFSLKLVWMTSTENITWIQYLPTVDSVHDDDDCRFSLFFVYLYTMMNK